ncbi:MAG: DsbA family protein [Proteobacteria bacterium]|nr:DsbA family protein [Pseudomonadota bacterium]
MPSLLYIADPMCPWSYGFGPELAALHQGLPDIPLHVIAGGLRVYQQEAPDADLRAALQDDCRKVEQATGLPFANPLLTQPDFSYDTEPACRAVVVARSLLPAAAFTVMQALQYAFFAEGRDLTDGKVLAEITSAVLTEAGHPIPADAFLSTWQADASIAATHDDFTQVNRWGIVGFPTLVLDRHQQLDLISSGFVAMPALVEKLQTIVDRDTQPPPKT